VALAEFAAELSESHETDIVRALTILPMVLPPVVGGVALLLAFGRLGIVGSQVDVYAA